MMKKNLAGFASDGAAVMTGKRNGLAIKLDDFVDNKIYPVHCMAHKLLLSIKRGLKEYEFIGDIEDTINDLHNFYNRNGHKRKSHLRRFAAATNEISMEINYIYDGRWIASEFELCTTSRRATRLSCKTSLKFRMTTIILMHGLVQEHTGP